MFLYYILDSILPVYSNWNTNMENLVLDLVLKYYYNLVLSSPNKK